MSGFLFRILLPGKFRDGGFMTIGTVLVLSLGIGLFQSVDVMFSSFYEGLLEEVLEAKDEASLISNPLAATSDEEDEAAFFNNKPAEPIAQKTEVPVNMWQSVCDTVESIPGISAFPVVRIPDFDFSLMVNNDMLTGLKALVVCADYKEYGLRVFDSLDTASISKFSSWRKEDSPVPVLVHAGLMPGVHEGCEFAIKWEGGSLNCLCVGLLERKAFSIPSIVLPLAASKIIRGRDSATCIAIRSAKKRMTMALFNKVSSAIREAFDDEYMVTYWEEGLEKVKGLFRSMRFLFLTTLSSIFIIVFFFAVASFSVLLAKKRCQIAVMLALGCPLRQLRTALIKVAFMLALCGIVAGYAIGLMLIWVLSKSWLAVFFKTLGINSIRYGWNPIIAMPVFLFACLLMVGAAYQVSRKLYRMNPITEMRA